MESHPQNPEFRNNPEKFHPCKKHSVSTNYRSICTNKNEYSLTTCFNTWIGPYLKPGFMGESSKIGKS